MYGSALLRREEKEENVCRTLNFSEHMVGLPPMPLSFLVSSRGFLELVPSSPRDLFVIRGDQSIN